ALSRSGLSGEIPILDRDRKKEAALALLELDSESHRNAESAGRRIGGSFLESREDRGRIRPVRQGAAEFEGIRNGVRARGKDEQHEEKESAEGRERGHPLSRVAILLPRPKRQKTPHARPFSNERKERRKCAIRDEMIYSVNFIASRSPGFENR